MNTKLGTLLKLLPIAKPNNINSLLQNINSVLPELNAENFIYHAELLVIYGDLLYKAVTQEKGDTRNIEYLNQFYSRLRSIGKLSLSNDITILEQAWKKFCAYCLSETDYTDIPQIDMFEYYFLKNRVNTLLADPTVCSRMVLQSLIPSKMHWIEEKNLERAILIAVRSLNKQKVRELLTFCENKKQSKLVELFWKYALQYGRCSIIEYLLTYQLALPDNIDDFKLTLRIAIRCDIKPVFAYILKKFSLLKILQYACDKGLYQIAYICLLNLPIEGSLKNLSLVSEIAAACGDVEVLKVFLSKCNNKERQTLYEQHILPNYVPTKAVTKNEAEQQKKEITDIYGDNQQIYELEFQRSVAIFLYYMKKGKFIFSMDAIPGCFTMVDCGDLRKEIACQSNTPFGDLFGVIRTHDSATQTKGKFDQYAKVTEKILAREGKVLPSGIPDVASLEYQVTAELASANVKLTVYRQSLYQAEKLADSIIWQHPSWLVFPQVLSYIQNIWLSIYQANKDNLTDKLVIASLKKIPRILHKLGHGCIYFRGSASIAEKITSAICGFLQLDELRKYQQQMPDCVAMITPDEDECVKIFPSIFGFNSYEEMLVTLKAGYLINVSRKESELNGLGNYLKEINDAEHKTIAQKTDDTAKTLVTEKMAASTLNNQKAAVQQTRLALSLNLLGEISENNINNIVSEIDASLTELTSNNFFQFGRQLVIYGILLFNKTYNQKNEIINNDMYKALQNLYFHLRRIDKLRPNTDIIYLVNICKKTIAFIRTDLKIGYNLEKGSFAYFFSINYVNNFLSDNNFCRIKLLESLIPDRIDWIDEKNLDQAIILAIKCSPEDIVQAFMLYFVGAKRIDILNIFMRYALQYGRCDTVEWLLNHRIAFPEKIQEVGLIFRLAVICRRDKIVSSLEEIFPLQKILNYCILSQDYELSFFILNNLPDSVVTLYGLSFITCIAASCGDIAALKVFISKCPEVDREKLFTQYIEPYYIPAKPLNAAKDVQDVFNQKFIRHVSIISYYMRINKFCFTLEPGEDGVFTLLDCGHLRKLIAYILKQDRYYEFGTIRSTSLSTVLSNEYESYKKSTETLILQNGYETQDEYLTLLPDLKAKEFSICAQLPTGKVILTTLQKPYSLTQHDIYDPKWRHAKWTDFPNILKHIQNILISFNAMRKEQHTHAMRIAALRLLVQIHYYFSPTCIYNRGSATVGETIISGAAITIELDDLRKHQKSKPDCISIITQTCEEYVENYPKIYGFKNYDEMVTTLHKEFMARMSRKEAELQELRLLIQNKCPMTQSSAINIISKLSTSEIKPQSVTAAAPTGNSKSNPALSAKLLQLKSVGDKRNSILFTNYTNLSEQELNRSFYGNSIEDLIKELCEKGPFLVTGNYGQLFYTVNPGPVTHDFADQKMTVYGWAPNTFKDNTTVDSQQVIVVGARKDGEKKYVYYIPTLISPTHPRQIFVISYARYKESLKQMQIKTENKVIPKNSGTPSYPTLEC